MKRKLIVSALGMTLLLTQIGFSPTLAQTVPPSQPSDNGNKASNGQDNTWLYILIGGGILLLLRHHQPPPSPSPTPSLAPPVAHTACEKGTAGYSAMKRGLLPWVYTGGGKWLVPWEADPTDSNHAFNSKTGQNAVWDDQKQQWFDAKTGQALGPSGLQK